MAIEAEALEIEGDIAGESGQEEEQYAAADILLAFLDEINLAERMDQYELGTLGQKVVKEYDIDKNSRSDWERQIDDAMKVAMQVVEEKTFPWPGAANTKYPLLTNAAIEFAARAYPAIIDGDQVVKGKVNGQDPQGQKQERADRVARHMSWQLLEDMPEWEADTDRLLHIIPIVGVVFRKTYFARSKGRNVSELVLGSDLVINYKAPSMEAAPRVTQRFDLYPHEIEERIRDGIWLEQDLGLPKSADGDDSAPHEFLEQHRRVDLDNDGYEEPYIVTVHKDTGTVMRIVAGYDEEGMVWEPDGRIVRVSRREYFTKYGFIPNPESAIYDLGFGMLLNPINETVNTVLNQLLDAGTMANTGGGFIGKGLRMKGGSIRLGPNEWKPLDVGGGTIRDNLVPAPTREPSGTLFSLLGLLIESGKDIASLKDVLTGEQQQANIPASTTLAMIEQGLKTFTATVKRIHRSLKSELQKLYALNREYLDPQVYFNFHDHPEAVSQKDYEDESLDIQPVSDASMVTDMQRMARAEALMQFNGDLFFNQKEIRDRYLSALRIDGTDTLLVDPPQGPTQEQIEADREFELKQIQEMREGLEAKSKIVERYAKAIEALADAESKEAGTQLMIYRQALEGIINDADNQRAVRRVANPSGDGNGPQVPGGLPGGNSGPMGR